MKKALEAEKILKKQGLRGSFKQKIERLRSGPLTCPFCREVFNGLSEMLSHLKEHCR